MPLFFLQFALQRFKAVARPGNRQLVKTNLSEKKFQKGIDRCRFLWYNKLTEREKGKNQ